MLAETLVDRIANLAKTVDTKPFLTLIHEGTPDRSYTYRELLDIQKCWAAGLKKAGLRQGRGVIIIWPHSEALYGALGGALLMGAVPALHAFPSPKLSDERYFAVLDKLITQSDADLIVVYPELAPRLREFLARHQIAIPLVSDVGLGDADNYALENTTVNSNDIAFLQFSSGTTGAKKGVAVTHRALLWQIHAYEKAINLDPSDIIVSWLPLYHDMGLIACFMLPWLTRTPLIVMSPFSWVARPELLLDKIHQYRATLCWQPNFAYSHIANRVEGVSRRRWDLTSMRMFINCSEPITESSHTRFVNVLSTSGVQTSQLGACYAMAENTFAVCNSIPGMKVTTLQLDAKVFELQQRALLARPGVASRVFISSGVALEGISVDICDASGNSQLDGVVGEIVIQAPCLFEGYKGNLDATCTALRGGRYFTGDLGFRWDGELFVTGRMKDMIIIAGKNIYPQDIEEVASRTEGVVAGRCVAFGVGDEQNGTERVVVIAETEFAEDEKKECLLARLYSRLNGESDLAVNEIHLVGANWLVKSTSGKISRLLNKRKYLEELPCGSDVSQEHAGSEDRLIRVLRGLLPRGGLNTPLSDDTRLVAGGLLDSLTLTALAVALEREYRVMLQDDFINALMVDDRVFSLRHMIDSAKNNEGCSQKSEEDWNNNTFASFVAGDDRRKYALAPQLADANRLGAIADPQLGMLNSPGYQSASLNTDGEGFRCTTVGERVVTWETFKSKRGAKGVVLGNSVAFGVGVTTDARTCVSLLNEGGNGSLWYNLALRRSNIDQEFSALKRYATFALDYIVWLSGINDLNFFLVDLANAIKSADLDRYSLDKSVWMANYGRFKTRYAEILREINQYRKNHNSNLIFALQPSLNWVSKRLTPEESILVSGFDCSFNMPLRRTLTSLITPFYQDYSNFLRKECEALGIRFTDFNQHSAFRESERWLFMDRLHLNDEGHAIIAHTLNGMVRTL